MTFIVDGTNGLTFNDSSTQNVTALNAANINAGTLGKARLPTGSVLQVVYQSYGTYTSTSSSSPVDTGLTTSITPTSASSKILVFVSINGIERGNNNALARFQIVRNSSIVFPFENAIYSGAGTSSIGYANSSTSYLDSPATTSSTTYKVQFNVSGSGSGTIYINNYSTGGDGTTKSTLTLMEIAA